MPGFPPIDRLYYENPTLRYGGLMAFFSHLYEQGRPHLNFVPGCSPYAIADINRFDCLSDVLTYLKSTHSIGRYYRGQSQRYTVTYSGQIEAISKEVPLTITFESLRPSFFRALGNDPDWNTFMYPKPVDTVAPILRNIARCSYDPLRTLAVNFLRQCRIMALSNLVASMGGRLGGAGTVSDTNLSHLLVLMISLAQHYEIPSYMIDITHDPEIAIWFASHRWSGEFISNREGDGVVYCFSGDKLNESIYKELATEAPASLAIYVASLFGLADLAELPAECGMRPIRQRGGSVFGFENSVIWQFLNSSHVSEIVTFPLQSISGKETRIDKGYICPAEDPVLQVFEPSGHLDHSILSSDELKALATQFGLRPDECEGLAKSRAMGFL